MVASLGVAVQQDLVLVIQAWLPEQDLLDLARRRS